MTRSQNAAVTTDTRFCNPRSPTAFLFEPLRCSQWAAVPLRLIVGFGFMEHGYAKLIKGPAAFVSILQTLGVPYAHVMAWLTILVELLGGFAVLVGAFVPLISVPLVGILVTAIVSVHLPYGFSSIKLIAITPRVHSSALRVMSVTCSIWLAWRHWYLLAPGHFQSMDCSGGGERSKWLASYR